MATDRGERSKSVWSYPPTQASFRRLHTLGLLAGTDVQEVARRIVCAVETGKRSVDMPARTVLFPMLANAPRRMVEVLLAGVPRS